MRVISLSVDGIVQSAQRGLYDWLANQDADLICLQDLRVRERDMEKPEYQLDGYFAYFFDSGTKNYNGVAIYTRYQPKALIYGLGFASGVDMEGRYLQVDYEQLSVGSLLAPSATSEVESQEVKIKFFDDFQAHLDKITRKRREYIFCGNWAMAHTPRDVSNSTENQHNSGFLPHERQWLSQLYNQLGYVDAFRRVNKDADEYSWWPSGVKGEGDGWRTDFQVVSNSIGPKVEYAAIYKTQQFSSHMPVIIDYDIELQP